MLKITKNALNPDTVKSDTFHVGIELELKMPSQSGAGDPATCVQNQIDTMRDELESLSTNTLLQDYEGLDRSSANAVQPYFNSDKYINDYLDSYDPDVCGDCDYCNGDSEQERDALADKLSSLTGNTSFKVVSDGSIELSFNEIDMEVCWNYAASKDMIKDNKKILDFLKTNGASYDKSCGLHINLNNYLGLTREHIKSRQDLLMLFNFVAGHRSASTYCNSAGLANEKYGMIFNQKDRLEFRFFSPTLDANLLNAYVYLANTVYKRLAGIDAKLSKRVAKYFVSRMIRYKKLTELQAWDAIQQVNSISKASYMPQQLTV